GAVRDRIASSQSQALGDIARDWLAVEEEASCGPWWPTTGDGTIDALALRGTTPVAAAAAVWATGIDAGAQREMMTEILRSSPYERPDRLFVLARSGTDVTRPEDLF